MKKISFLFYFLILLNVIQAEATYLQKYQAMNDKVLINIGANWCLPCKFYKKKIFDTKAFKQYVKAENVVYIELDYADKDAKSILKDFNQSGIPFYLFISNNQTKVVEQAGDWRNMFANIKETIKH